MVTCQKAVDPEVFLFGFQLWHNNKNGRDKERWEGGRRRGQESNAFAELGGGAEALSE